MATRYVYIKTARTGGAVGALDAMDGLTGGKGGAALATGDVCFVFESDKQYTYYCDTAGGAGESNPDIIVPDTNPGSINWVLQNTATRIDDLSAAEDNTDLNVSISAHGLCPKGTDTGTKFLKDDATWDTPAYPIDISGTPVQYDYFRFTNADTGEGRSYAEMKTDLGLNYNIIYVDAGAMVGCTTNPAESGTNEYGTNDIDFDYFAFDAGATKERVQFKLVMPEDWDRGTLRVKFHWSSATSSTAGDTVEWGIKAGAFTDSDAIDAALGDAVVISDVLLADNGGDLQLTDTTPALTVGGTPALHDLVVFEVYRNTDGTDDMAEDAWLFGISVQYLKSNIVSVWS